MHATARNRQWAPGTGPGGWAWGHVLEGTGEDSNKRHFGPHRIVSSIQHCVAGQPWHGKPTFAAADHRRGTGNGHESLIWGTKLAVPHPPRGRAVGDDVMLSAGPGRRGRRARQPPQRASFPAGGDGRPARYLDGLGARVVCTCRQVDWRGPGGMIRRHRSGRPERVRESRDGDDEREKAGPVSAEKLLV